MRIPWGPPSLGFLPEQEKERRIACTGARSCVLDGVGDSRGSIHIRRGGGSTGAEAAGAWSQCPVHWRRSIRTIRGEWCCEYRRGWGCSSTARSRRAVVAHCGYLGSAGQNLGASDAKSMQKTHASSPAGRPAPRVCIRLAQRKRAGTEPEIGYSYRIT